MNTQAIVSQVNQSITSKQEKLENVIFKVVSSKFITGTRQERAEALGIPEDWVNRGLTEVSLTYSDYSTCVGGVFREDIIKAIANVNKKFGSKVISYRINKFNVLTLDF